MDWLNVYLSEIDRNPEVGYIPFSPRKKEVKKRTNVRPLGELEEKDPRVRELALMKFMKEYLGY